MHSPQAELSNLKEIEYPPVDLNTSPTAAYILNKHPRQSWLKDRSPAAYQHSKESLPRHSSKLPQKSPVQFSSPGNLEFISPSNKLIPSRFWKLTPSQSTNTSLGFIQRVISLPGYNWVILSQKPRKERPRRSLLIPSEVY